MLVFTKRVKLFARDLPAQTQSFRARADPLAGSDFTGGVIIVLCQMLVEVALGIGQILMGNGCEHKTRHYLFCKKALFVFQTTFNFPNIFIFRFVILHEGESPKLSLGHKMRLPSCRPIKSITWLNAPSSPNLPKIAALNVQALNKMMHSPFFQIAEPGLFHFGTY
jgi:hypothetical protein